MSKILIVSTSLRANSNSEYLARECEKGAADGGNKRAISFICVKLLILRRIADIIILWI